MPIYSYRCEWCKRDEDRFSSIAERNNQFCVDCTWPLFRVYTPTNVIDDSIPGGFVQENFGSKPETFYSKKEMARRASELGLQPFVRHSGKPGSDKSPHTVRWI